MLPGGINPKQMKAMMKKMGMEVAPIENVTSIVITTPGGRYVFGPADVVAMTMQGVTTYQISGGEPRFEPADAIIPDEDVALVSEQAGVSPEEARAALEAAGGDIAGAILALAERG
ncbi:MAG TPA: nascent polypeptide-associated complex protein [Methanoregulaceae archaeon]|nr:nascent polypeptide-associated complex protein [Methanoregulaceae archaeon]HOV67198.1 nascent polypeptide-associated complex protein [Methanoregulaceae archaeon]HQJ87689.1 nascent polypeptide-associated complex protein [Methanoregulaceae archaeon]